MRFQWQTLSESLKDVGGKDCKGRKADRNRDGHEGSNRVGEIWKTEMTRVQWSAVGVEGEKRGYKGKQCIGKEILGRHHQMSSAVGARLRWLLILTE